jgi:PAS domain S-box-containing protein
MNLTSDAYRVLSAVALEKTSEGMLCLNPLGQIVFANDAGARILGYAPAALGESDIFHIAPEMVPALWKEFWKELRTSGSFCFEFQLNAADGRVVQVDVAAHRVDNSC